MGPVGARTKKWPPFSSFTPGHLSFAVATRDSHGVNESAKMNPGYAAADSLPPIGYLDLGTNASSGQRPQSRPPQMNGSHPAATPPVSPTTSRYHTNPSSHTHTSSLPNSDAMPQQAGYVYHQNPQPLQHGERDHQSPLPALNTHRQSLPSIHEALGGNPLSFQTSPSAATTHHPASAESASGPPNPFAHTTFPTSFDQYSTRSITKPASMSDGQRSSIASIHSQESRNPSIMSLGSGKSPTQAAKTIITHSAGYESQKAASPGPASPTVYSSFATGHSYQQNDPQPTAATATGPFNTQTPVPRNANQAEPALAEPATSGPLPRDTLLEASKRQLEPLDLQATWIEIAERSGHILDFTRIHVARIYQSNAPDETIPSLNEIDDLLQAQLRNVEALKRIRDVVLDQEHAVAEQRERMMIMQTEHPYNGIQTTRYREELRNGGGFAVNEAKKRRGKPAPPGKCHSCNRSETPEWRRGPDGARTLCNACGLHYAKLTRKIGPKAAAQLRSRSLLDPRSAPHPQQ